MRLLSFFVNRQERLGIEHSGRIIDANYACRVMLFKQGKSAPERLADALLPADAVDFLTAGERALNQAREVIKFVDEVSAAERAEYTYGYQDVRLLAPVPHPGKVICVGRNYHDHVSEMKREVPKIPVIFAKLANTVCACGDGVPFPKVSEQFDYEAELAVVIGKSGRYIPEENALDHVAGYTALNDITVRDWQHRTPQWLQGKSFDKTAPIGPIVVTKDEIPDPHKLDIKLWLNDELRQSDNTSQLIFSIPYLISFISQVMTLEPGDVIATGTPGGVGVAMNPQGFMKVGDTVKVEIQHIGVLQNHIVEG
ncbi:fumarylacetoacetate hydrolase family protein [Alicyclobacillus dauci]|uniref:Fumarylacetoacetate hydrolase family protein n=1 Tax=Alicyclobacillus dauci TaxID=1475485 RepID=A0ABY6YYV6_9BACL|nr:fumarylacetoacetate hydrolase family protein [Alicyclobacillus dauci]WAH35634.1 fumarylacetoacetate hydrolase family protein [Alicyclobacillus dauci]